MLKKQKKEIPGITRRFQAHSIWRSPYLCMSKITFARWVSIIGHPFTFLVLLVFLAYWLRSETGVLQAAGFVVSVGLVPLGLFMWKRVASGRWQTVDASARTDRPVLYIASLAVCLPLILYFHFVAQVPLVVRGGAVIGLMLGVAAVLNRWIKLSLHLAFACFYGLILARIRLTYSMPMGLFIPLLAWSRLTLSRHTPSEVIGGSALGLVGASIVSCLWL
jgi:hypothetical protein